ncbi:baseplate hub protein [Achromobacter phage Mano]|uniref:Baseplate hub protein n=1 Tax=Achromobacter phage Mano TaxID=2767570 RepID=A0A7L8G8H3_9CAUD|nr:tail protein [Achromobacter phage Mano]QOE32758.1 baseplate hub protein [Achromobacter phage Mano]
MVIQPIAPAYRILANQADITAAVLDRFVSLRLTDETGLESDMFEMTLADHDPQRPIAMPDTGAELEVFLGYDSLVQRMGLFVCDEVELSGWPAQMTIRGRAAPYDASKGGKSDLQTQKSRSWKTGTKLGDMVAKIAKEHGMEPAVGESLRGVVLSHWDQTAESDLSFLLRVGKRYDAIVKAADGKLVMTKRGESKTADGQDLPTVTITPQQVGSYRLTLARKESPGTVVAFWHTTKQSRRIEIRVGEGEPVRQLRHYYPTEESAKTAAQAELDKRARGEHKVTLTMVGDPTLCAEARLVLAGFRDGLAGEWLITRVEHSVDPATGYQCTVEAEKPNASADDDGGGRDGAE